MTQIAERSDEKMDAASTDPVAETSPPVAETPGGSVWTRYLRSFHPRALRPFARRNYRHELLAVSTWPVAVTMIEWAVTGTIAKKAFPDTPAWIIAVLAGAPAYSNVASSVWARLAHGRGIVRNLNMLQVGVLIMIGVIATVPINSWGLYLFTAAAVFARVLMAGVVTLRSVLWRANYVRADRATIIGKLITIQTIIVSMVSLGFGQLMDINPSSFRFIYPAGLLVGAIGVMAFSRVRIRHPFRLVDETMISDSGGAGPSSIGLINAWGRTLLAMGRVLRDDLPYRGFMACMFVMGISNLALTAPMLVMLDEQFGLGYFWTLVLLQSIPLICMPIAIPLWSRLLDRVHIIRYRMYHTWIFVLANLLLFFGAWTGSIWLVALAQVARGLGFGGGALAWNIGHNDFASAEKAGLYMSIHVTLTGVRGIIGVFLGVLLYTGNLGPIHIRPLAEYSFLFWAALCTLGSLGFVYLNYKLAHITDHRPEHD